MWHSNQDSSLESLKGKVALVTGSNTGLGYEAVRQLASRGAKVYMAARSKSKATEAIRNLRQSHPNLPPEMIKWLPLDLEDLSSIVEAAREISASENRLDILINNAGLATDEFQLTQSGLERNFAVNHVGHFLLVQKLIPLLKSASALGSGDVRVVTVSSAAHSWFIPSTLTFDKIQDFKYPGITSQKFNSMRDKFSRYAVSKLANILFAAELQRRCDAEGVKLISTSVNPGPVATHGGKLAFPGFVRPLFARLAPSPGKGVRPILYLAVAKEVAQNPDAYKGKYFNPSCKAETPSVAAQDPKMADALWRTTESWLGENLAL